MLAQRLSSWGGASAGVEIPTLPLPEPWISCPIIFLFSGMLFLSLTPCLPASSSLQEPLGMGTASFPIRGRETRAVVRWDGNRTREMCRGRQQMQGRRSWLCHALPACYTCAPKHSSGSLLSCMPGCEISQGASFIHRVTALAILGHWEAVRYHPRQPFTVWFIKKVTLGGLMQNLLKERWFSLTSTTRSRSGVPAALPAPAQMRVDGWLVCLCKNNGCTSMHR